MSPKEEESTIHNYSHVFVDRKGGAIFIKKLDDSMHQALIKKYLAYQPRDSFEGLPPIEDEACVKWVWKMIRDGTNLVALASEGDIVGHGGDFFHRPAAVRNADRGLASISESRDWHGACAK
jgi:hypothetical protein